MKYIKDENMNILNANIDKTLFTNIMYWDGDCYLFDYLAESYAYTVEPIYDENGSLLCQKYSDEYVGMDNVFSEKVIVTKRFITYCFANLENVASGMVDYILNKIIESDFKYELHMRNEQTEFLNYKLRNELKEKNDNIKKVKI